MTSGSSTPTPHPLGGDLLFISPVLPRPSGNGLAMRAYHTLHGFVDSYRVHLLVTREPQHRQQLHEPLARKLAGVELFHPNSGRIHRWRRRGRSLKELLLSERAWATPSQWRNAEAQAKSVGARCFAGQRFDRMHAFRLESGLYALARSAVHHTNPSYMGLDIDDYESLTRARIGNMHRRANQYITAFRLHRDARHCSQLESQILPKFDELWVTSSCDRARLIERGFSAEIKIVPNRVPSVVAASAKIEVHSPLRMLFVGNLSYAPNEDALTYFCQDIAPELHARLPGGFTLDVVGGDASRRLRRTLTKATFVNYHGPLPELSEAYRNCDLSIVPLRAGGGTRLKILEALAHARPVVSTTLGAEGLGLTHENELLLGDDPASFAEQCLRLANDQQLRCELVRRATARFQAEYALPCPP